MKLRPFLLAFAISFAAVTQGEIQAQTPPPGAPSNPSLTTPQGKLPPPPPVDIANEPTVRVVANVQPAVVNITAEATVPQYVTKYDQYFRLYRGVIPRTSQSIGSGLIVSADGYIITNAHVVALAETKREVDITLNSGSKYHALIINADEDKDLALLKIEDTTAPFPYFDLTYTSPNLLGEAVIALGSPAGYQNSVSQGILSAKNRSFTVEEHTYNNLIQTDAAINPGNSGGPLVDMNGGLVGINSAKMSGQAIESIGFAIPHDVVVPWTNEAIAEAKGLKPAPVAAATALDVFRDRFGISLKVLTPEKAAAMGLELPGGLIISHVEPGGSAAAIGIREGMIIVSMGNRQIVDEKSIPKEVLQLQTGDTVGIRVIWIQSMGLINMQRGATGVLTAK
jgi:S1-C subfamily serine protease